MWVKKHLHLDKFEKHERTKRNKDKQSTAVGSTDLVPGGHADLCFQPGRRPEIWQHEPSCVLLYRRIHIRSATIFPRLPCAVWAACVPVKTDGTGWHGSRKQQIKEWRGDERERQGRGGEGRGTRIPINSEEAFKRVQTWKCSLRR